MYIRKGIQKSFCEWVWFSPEWKHHIHDSQLWVQPCVISSTWNPNAALWKVCWFLWSIASQVALFKDSRSFPDSSAGKESACNSGDPDLIPELGRSAEEGIGYSLQYSWASLVAQLVKNLPAMWETWVWPLGWEDPLEKRKVNPLQYSGLENSMSCGPWGHRESDTTEQLSLSWPFTSRILRTKNKKLLLAS